MEIVIVIVIVATILLIIGKATDKGIGQSAYFPAEHTNFPKVIEFPTRGTQAEWRLIHMLERAGISEKAIFHDLYIRKRNGRFSQIDLVVATRVGIIVFEVKDYSGWLFGDGRHQQWTQVLNFGREKHRFYNPILQNNAHIDELRRRLCHLGDFPFFSVIVFFGNCELKEINFVPPGTFVTTDFRVIDVVDKIFNENDNAYFSNKWEIVRILKQFEANGEDAAIQNQHIDNIRDMLGKDRVFD